jgi:polyhydroxyalkanoate synthesis regulator phasin
MAAAEVKIEMDTSGTTTKNATKMADDLFALADKDENGNIDKKEFYRIFEYFTTDKELAKQKSVKRNVGELTQQVSQLKAIIAVAVSLLVVSVASNCGVTWALLDANKETSVTEDGLWTKRDSDSVLRVNQATASYYVWSAPYLSIDELETISFQCDIPRLGGVIAIELNVAGAATLDTDTVLIWSSSGHEVIFNATSVTGSLTEPNGGNKYPFGLGYDITLEDLEDRRRLQGSGSRKRTLTSARIRTRQNTRTIRDRPNVAEAPPAPPGSGYVYTSAVRTAIASATTRQLLGGR